MSEVLGTILILALTVTLFSSIFFFVNTFPKPAAQPTSQFQGQLYYTYVGTVQYVSNIVITHLGGPTIYNYNTRIYVVSQAHPQLTTATYTIGSGGLGTTPGTAWGTGQVWNLTLYANGVQLSTPDNITVTIVSNSQVVYRQTLPGTNPTIPPIFNQEGTSPGSPIVNSPFSIYVQITDPFLPTTSHKVLLNVTTPGLSCTNPLSAYSTNTTTLLRMTYNSTNGLWFIPSCTTATAGTYYVTVWVTDADPILAQMNSIVFPISVSTTSGSGGSALVAVNILTNSSAPVIGQPLSVVVDVTNNGAVSGTATVYFGPTAEVSPTSTSGTVAPGATVGFQTTFTGTASGAVLLNASATIPGLGTGSDTLALTVFPHILLISENVLAGTVPTRTNESANLAAELVGAGFPFTTWFVSCSAASYPKTITSQFVSGAVAIIDFGTNTSQMTSCAGLNYNATTDTAEQIVSGFANGTSFWVVGSRAISNYATGCANANYQAYMQVFGLKTAATNCVGVAAFSTTAANPIYYTASSSLLAAGLSSPIYANGNVTGMAGFTPYKTLTLATTGNKGTAFMREGSTTGTIVGAYYAGTGKAAVMTTIDPVQFGDTPVAASWNGIGAEVAYNVVNYLCGLATTTAPSRSGVDFGIAGALITGTLSHTTYNTIYVNLRANDATNGILTVTMLVGGAPAIYQGTIVQATLVEAGNGVNSWVALTWQAPAAGTYAFSFVLSTSPTDGFLLNNQYNYYLTGQGLTFT